MSSQTAADVLCRENEHCQRLLEAVRGPGPIKADELSYEDVFYPLRCHYQDGLALRLTLDGTIVHQLVWGPGDFIYEADDPEKTFYTAIDPFSRYEELQTGQYSLDIVVVEEDSDGPV